MDEPDRLLRGPRAVSAESHQEFPLGGFFSMGCQWIPGSGLNGRGAVNG